jgi:homoprotocatechuate degradation regulator HpaR
MTPKPQTRGQDGPDRGARPIREFSRSLPMALLRAREAVMRHFRALLREQGLTEQQWRVLRALTTVEDVEAGELARLTVLLGPSLSRILPDLEQRRLIRRRTLKSDLRRSVISITPAGLALIARVGPQSEAIYADIARRFGSARLEALHGLLAELEDSMGGRD